MLAVAAGFLIVAGAVGLVANLVGGSGGGGTTIQLISANGTTTKARSARPGCGRTSVSVRSVILL